MKELMMKWDEYYELYGADQFLSVLDSFKNGHAHPLSDAADEYREAKEAMEEVLKRRSH